MKSTARTLSKWYEQNKRDLPWRHTRDPYLIWLSEIILQQTRVDQGLSYYVRFSELFPDVAALAEAPEDLVLKTWQGLGYYSRARNLHFSARMVMSDYQGKFPTTFSELIKLKGVGQYTAAAIASFSSGERVPVIDGNVMRVISRLFGITEAIDTKPALESIRHYADELIRSTDPATHNQAMMEFGALQCVPKNPDCAGCPLRTSCKAYALGLVATLPSKSKKTAVRPIWMYYFVVHDKKGIYFKRRNDSGIWKGLYDFPEISLESDPGEEEALKTFVNTSGMPEQIEIGQISPPFRHILSHRKISARFIPIYVREKWQSPAGWKAYKTEEIADLGVSRLVEKYLESGHILNK